MSVRPTLQLWPFCFAFQVLAEELNAVKRRRAEKRAEQRVLAQQEKILKQRRMLPIPCCPSPAAHPLLPAAAAAAPPAPGPAAVAGELFSSIPEGVRFFL